tara:strand:+ start:2211 stop:3221 length:1011 start_codon:yes stop_codon:yes gene_type:complete
MLKNFENHEFLNGQNFSKIADVIFAINVPNKNLSGFNIDDYKIISKNSEFTGLKLKNLKIKNGDIVFCNSSYLSLFFKYLERLNKITSITLITSQSDFSVTKKVFTNKPESVKKWFAVNVAYKDRCLIPIPLGLANNYSPKNIRINDLVNFKFEKVEKVNKLYVNLRKSTNYKERENIEKIFRNKEWVIIKEPNLSIDDYISDLNKYKFILCPWGNGFDTHRIWESLYCGSIPITKSHVGLSFGNLPIISFENFNNLSIEKLITESNKIDYNFESLNLKYWNQLIKTEINLDEEGSESIDEINYVEFLYWNQIKIFKFINSKLKIVRFYLKKLLKS